ASLIVLLLAPLAFAQTTPPVNDTTQAVQTQPSEAKGGCPAPYDTPALKYVDSTHAISNLRDLKGKVVFINLWATWCAPCLMEMPTIYKLRQTFKDRDDLVFLMVDVENKLDKAQKWMDKNKIDLPVFGMASQIPLELFSGSIP